MSLFELIFGQPTINKLRKDLTECNKHKLTLTRNYQTLVLEKLQLVLNYSKDKMELHQQIRDLEHIIAQFEEDAEESFNWPSILQYDAVGYDVSAIQAFRDVEFVRADARYNLFTKTDWMSILDKVHPLVEEALVRWKRDISDCDNWSTVSAAFVSIAFKKSGYNIQGAFAIAHTVMDEPARHAYNVFVTKDYKVWVYEPQNNTVLQVMEDMDKLYKTGFVWFMN